VTALGEIADELIVSSVMVDATPGEELNVMLEAGVLLGIDAVSETLLLSTVEDAETSMLLVGVSAHTLIYVSTSLLAAKDINIEEPSLVHSFNAWL
jgi:hypothetical protein